MSAVPSELIWPYVERYTTKNYISLEDLSEWLGYHKDALRNAERSGGFSFWMADRVLCRVANGLMTWMTDENLTPIYIETFLKKCKYQRCGEEFMPHWPGQLYCSTKCKKRRASDKWNKRHSAIRRRQNAARMRRVREKEKRVLTPEEMEYRRMKNRIYKRKYRARQKEAA